MFNTLNLNNNKFFKTLGFILITILFLAIVLKSVYLSVFVNDSTEDIDEHINAEVITFKG